MVGAVLRRIAGVRLAGDVYEQACAWGIAPPLSAKRRQRLARIRAARVLFIHVPKNAGMSVSQALYGQQVGHASARYYARLAPDLLEETPSFAVLRDPVARFVSAYRYARAGGSGDNRVAAAFRAEYRSFQSVDDALDHVESAETVFDMDHIFRPQAWYVTDRQGEVAVERLLFIDQLGRIDAMVRDQPTAALPHLNRSFGRTAMSSEQIARLRRLYPQDFDLVAGARQGGHAAPPTRADAGDSGVSARAILRA